jgi:hypothetical protein
VDFSVFASSRIRPSISRGFRELHSGCFFRIGWVDPDFPLVRAWIRAILFNSALGCLRKLPNKLPLYKRKG